MKPSLLVLGLSCLLGAGPLLCAAETPAGTAVPAVTGRTPFKDGAGNTIFSLIQAKDHDRLVAFLAANPETIRDRATNLDTPLHAAIDAGDQTVIQLLLKSGVATDALDGKKATPLIAAVRQKDTTTVTHLLAAKVPIDAQDVNGFCALHLAVQVHSPELIKLLLESGASIDPVDVNKALTPVHLAYNLGRDDLARQMIEAQFSETKNRPFFLLHSEKPGDMVTELENNPNLLDRRLAGGWSLLHQAVADRQMDAVTYLLDNGFDPYARDCRRRCALHYAAEAGNLEFVQRLVEKAVDEKDKFVNVVDERKTTPLALAVRNNHLEVCKFLLGNMANPNIGNDEGKNLAFDMAACNDAMAELLSGYSMAMDPVDTAGRTPIFYAVANAKRTQLFLKAGARVAVKDKLGRTLLHAAAEAGNLETVRILLANRIAVDDMDQAKRTALHQAAIKGHAAVVNMLLEHGANPELVDGTGNTALHFAVYNVESLHTLLKRHVRVDVVTTQTKLTPMVSANIANEKGSESVLRAYMDTFAAAKSGELEAIQAVFKQLNADRETAIKDGHIPLAKVLTETPGYLMTARDHTGATPLLVAAEAGHAQVVNFLFQCGAEVAATRLDGSSALHLAAAANRGAVIPLLLQKQAEVNVTNAAEETPLHLAAANNATEAAKLLIAAKANLEATDKNGKTPLQIAQAAEKKEVADLLAKAAKPE